MSRVRGRLPEIALALAFIAALVAINRLVPGIDAQKALHDVSNELGAVTYALAALAAFLETGAFVGLVLPGETVVILAGAVAGQGATSIEATILVVWVGAFAGDSTSFWIGKRLGRDFLLRHGPKLRITEARLERVEGYFERYGGRTIIVGRFIGLVRALAPFTAGTSGWRYRNYFPYGLIGTGLWSAAFCLVGYFASKHINDAIHVVGRVTFIVGVIAAIGVALVLVVRYIRRAGPLERFRVQLGALVGAFAIGTATLVALGIVVGANPGPTALDTSAFEVVRHLDTAWLVDVSKVLTQLGSAAVTLPLALIVGVALGVRRQWADLVVLGAALAITYLAVDQIKALVDRPRPPGSLVDTTGSSYPSGHAAHAAIYPWLAVVFAARARLRPSPAATALAIGFGFALVVGLTRVYLRAHFMTDVLGGWGLGAAAFAGPAAVAVLVVRFRHNQRDDAAAG